MLKYLNQSLLQISVYTLILYFGILYKIIHKYKKVFLTSKANRIDWIYKVGVYKLIQFACLFLKIVEIIDFCDFYILKLIIYVFYKIAFIISL